MAVPVACQHGPALRRGRCAGGRRHLVDRLAKAAFSGDGVARAHGLPPDKVHGIWIPGPGSYGRNDAGIDAAFLSKAVGRPARVQGMRYEGHGWDPKGPASIHRARAALDQDGAVIGYAFEIRASRASTSTPTRATPPTASLAS